MHIANDDVSSLDDYFNSDYDILYAISYFPKREDVYNVFLGNVKIRKEISIGVKTDIAEASFTQTRGETQDYKIYYVKLSKSDIVSAIESTSYTTADVNHIEVETSNSGTKNYGMRTVWMTTQPTEEQCLAIRDFFENGGEL